MLSSVWHNSSLPQHGYYDTLGGDQSRFRPSRAILVPENPPSIFGAGEGLFRVTQEIL